MKVVAGDFKENAPIKLMGRKYLFVQEGVFRTERLHPQDIADFNVVTEDNKASILGKVGWGFAGAVLLGPLGLLAGVIGGGNRRDRLMALTLNDGRKGLIKGNADEAESIRLWLFQAEADARKKEAKLARQAPKAIQDISGVDTSRWSAADKKRYGLE